jgi:hypothetical protein
MMIEDPDNIPATEDVTGVLIEEETIGVGMTIEGGTSFATTNN